MVVVGDAIVILCVETKDTDPHPVMHRASPTKKSTANVNGTNVEKLCFQQYDVGFKNMYPKPHSLVLMALALTCCVCLSRFVKMVIMLISASGF